VKRTNEGAETKNLPNRKTAVKYHRARRQAKPAQARMETNALKSCKKRRPYGLRKTGKRPAAKHGSNRQAGLKRTMPAEEPKKRNAGGVFGETVRNTTAITTKAFHYN
jgi:hypothetical protein